MHAQVKSHISLEHANRLQQLLAGRSTVRPYADHFRTHAAAGSFLGAFGSSEKAIGCLPGAFGNCQRPLGASQGLVDSRQMPACLRGACLGACLGPLVAQSHWEPAWGLWQLPSAPKGLSGACQELWQLPWRDPVF